MGITVKEAMQIGGLAKCRIVAGEQGCDREIEFITVMEVPDVIQWLNGNDLLITSLYPIKDDENAIKQIVSQLVEKGSSALAIKTRRFIEKIPDVIIFEGNRLGFPIIEIDEKVSYIDIMTPLMGTIINRSAIEQKDVEGVLKWITELSMGGKGIDAILKEVEKLLGNKITVEAEFPLSEANGELEYIEPLSWKQKKDLKQAKCSIQMQRVLNHRSIPCIVTPIVFNDVLYGQITCWQTNKKFRQVDFMILDRVVLLLALEFLKVKTKIDVEQRYKDELLRIILHGQIKEKEEILTKAKMYGWDLSLNYQVFLIEIKKVKRALEERNKDNVYIQEYFRKMIRQVEQFVATMNRSSIVGLEQEEIVVLMPMDGPASLDDHKYKDKLFLIADSIQNYLRAEYRDTPFIIGIGRWYEGLDGIHQGYAEAKKAIQLGQKVWKEKSNFHFDDLGIYRILSNYPDRQELFAIYKETVGKIVEYDQTTNSNLTETLIEYFANHFF